MVGVIDGCTKRQERATYFFSEPSFSFRDVYCPFNVLYTTQGTHYQHSAAAEPGTTHNEPLEDGNRAFFVGLRV